jgi:hypothetical protein
VQGFFNSLNKDCALGQEPLPDATNKEAQSRLFQETLITYCKDDSSHTIDWADRNLLFGGVAAGGEG